MLHFPSSVTIIHSVNAPRQLLLRFFENIFSQETIEGNSLARNRYKARKVTDDGFGYILKNAAKVRGSYLRLLVANSNFICGERGDKNEDSNNQA